MDSEDFESEELVVSEAIGLAFHGFDLVVRAFQGARGNGVGVVGQDSQRMKTEGPGEVLKHADARRFGVADPFHQGPVDNLVSPSRNG